MTKFKRMFSNVIWLSAGIVIGGFLFSKTQPRSFLAVKNCQYCTNPSDFAGLVASVGMQKFSGLIPGRVLETDKVLVIRHPLAKKRFHFVIIPKKDIKDASDISEEDAAYLMEVYRVARMLIKEHHMVDYRFYTNGPGHQTVTYLHFHLISD